MSGQPPRIELADMVRELTERHTHREHYQVKQGRTWVGQNHLTDVPSLIQQLQLASPSGQVDQRDDAGYASRPAARLEALDTLLDIDREAARWVRWLGHDDPGDQLVVVNRIPATLGPTCRDCRHSSCASIRRGEYVERKPIPGSGTLACIRLLHSLTPQLPDATRRSITRDVRRWWTWARIATGWDSPAWRPDNTCPMCGERRTLRINLVAELAVCVHEPCRETWDQSSLGLLADHIRLESETERAPTVQPVPCHCRVPMQQQGRWGLCPACGSSVCVNAEVVAEREAQRRAAAAEAEKLEQLERIAARAVQPRPARRASG